MTETEKEPVPVMVRNDFWLQLSCLDERLKVIDYLLNHRSGEYAIGTIKQISNDTGLSINRVQKYLKKLENAKLIQRKGQGVICLLPKYDISDVNIRSEEK